LAAFGAHLMISRQARGQGEKGASITQAVQVNIGQLPRTFAEFTAARQAELPSATPAQLAAELGTSEPTVRKLLERAGVVIETRQQED
jgi:DNA-binding MurR/RpiR family transcriptional regulator